MRACGNELFCRHRLLTKSPNRLVTYVITIWTFLFSNILPLEASNLKLNKNLAWADPPSGAVLPASGISAASGPGLFKLPYVLGEISNRFEGNSGKTVIFIQDAHCNYSAQRAIKSIIEYYNHYYNVDTVALEGGDGDYDLRPFTRIDDIEVRNEVLDYFVKAGRINGAEYFACMNPDRVVLKGIENSSLYKKTWLYIRTVLNIEVIFVGLSKESRHMYRSSKVLYSQKNYMNWN